MAQERRTEPEYRTTGLTMLDSQCRVVHSRGPLWVPRSAEGRHGEEGEIPQVGQPARSGAERARAPRHTHELQMGATGSLAGRVCVSHARAAHPPHRTRPPV